MRGPITTETTPYGGVRKAIGRLFTGESLFMSRYVANGPAEIAFASSFPGRIIVRELAPGQSIVCQKSAFLCGMGALELSVHFKKRLGTGFFGGEGTIVFDKAKLKIVSVSPCAAEGITVEHGNAGGFYRFLLFLCLPIYFLLFLNPYP